MGFIPSRHDKKVWIKLREDVNDDTATHEDDLIVVAKDRPFYMSKIKEKFDLRLEWEIEYFLGHNIWR